MAQRDKLRKIQEEKRQEELKEFQSKTETKSSLFAELKKMDDETKSTMKNTKEAMDLERRRNMMRKAHEDAKKDT